MELQRIYAADTRRYKKARVPHTLHSRTTFASLTPTGLHPWLAYYFRLRRNNTTTPSASNAHVDGSGTPAAGSA